MKLEEQVLKLWQGLGYYSRARNLHATSKFIANELNGEFPDNFNELIKLKNQIEEIDSQDEHLLKQKIEQFI